MRSNIGLAAAVLASGLVAQAYGAVVSAPYSDNFSSAPGGVGSSMAVTDNRPDTGDTIWEAVPGGALHTYNDSSWGLASSAAYVNVSNLPDDFVVSANVKPVTNGIYAGLTGLVAASSTSNYGGWSSAYYAGYIRLATGGAALNTLTVGVQSSNASNYPSTLASIDSAQPFSIGTIYSMTLTGDYNASGLTLSFSVTEAGNPLFVPVTATHTVLTADIFPNLGNAFGIRDELQAGEMKMEYSNFAVSAVPEPVSLGFVVLGAMGLMSRRRKDA